MTGHELVRLPLVFHNFTYCNEYLADQYREVISLVGVSDHAIMVRQEAGSCRFSSKGRHYKSAESYAIVLGFLCIRDFPLSTTVYLRRMYRMGLSTGTPWASAFCQEAFLIVFFGRDFTPPQHKVFDSSITIVRSGIISAHFSLFLPHQPYEQCKFDAKNFQRIVGAFVVTSPSLQSPWQEYLGAFPPLLRHYICLAPLFF